MSLAEISVLHATLGNCCERLTEFNKEFLTFLDFAVSDATAVLSRGSGVSLPRVPALKRGRRQKKASKLTLESVNNSVDDEVRPPLLKRAQRLRSAKSSSDAAAGVSSSQLAESIVVLSRIDDALDEPVRKKTRSPWQPTATSSLTISAPSVPGSAAVSSDDAFAEPVMPCSLLSAQPAIKRPETPSKPPRRNLRLASQSARNKINQNYLDENTDPAKLRLEGASVVSKVVSGKGRKKIPPGSSPVLAVGSKNHQMASALGSPVDNCNGARKSSSAFGLRISQRVKQLRMQESTAKKPVPTMASGRSSDSPPCSKQPNFRSFVQVSLSPVRVSQVRQLHVTCSPMNAVGVTRGTFVVENGAVPDKCDLIADAQPVGRGTFVVPNTDISSDPKIRDADGVNRETSYLLACSIPVVRASDANSRRRRMVSRVMARASRSSAKRMSVFQMSRESETQESEHLSVEITESATGMPTPQLEQLATGITEGAAEMPTSPLVTDDSNIDKKLFKKFSLKELVVVIQDCKMNVSTGLRQQELTPDSGVETASNVAFSPAMSKKSTGVTAVAGKENEHVNETAKSPDRGSYQQGDSFVSCRSISNSSSHSVISNTPSPACPPEKVVRPKLTVRSIRKVSQDSKLIRGGAVPSKSIVPSLGSALKHLFGGGKMSSSAAGIRRWRANAAAEEQADRVSLVGKQLRAKKLSGIGPISSSNGRTSIKSHKRSGGSLVTGTVNTPLANKLNRQHTQTMSQQRSEDATKKREALMVQRAEEQKRKMDEKERKLLEAQDKKRQLHEEKTKKLKEQQEERKQQILLQKKREKEELERLNRLAEQRKLQEEKQREKERLRELEVEAKLNAAKMERQRENERIAREKAEMERLHAAERALKEKQEQANKQKQANLKDTVSASQNATKQKSALNVTFSIDQPEVCVNYDMTPQQILPLPNPDPDNYDITDLKEDSTDDEGQPRKEIPSWATGRNFRLAVLEQFRNPPDFTKIFPPSELMHLPQLDVIFKVKKARYNQRGSSADWNTPPIKKITKQ